MGVVAVHADGVSGDVDCLSRDALDGALLDDAHDARHGEVLVGDGGVVLSARHERALVGVVAVGEEFLRHMKPRGLPCTCELAAGECHQGDVGVEVGYCLRDGLRERRVDGRAVVQLPVGLHVRELNTFGVAERCEGAHLVQHIGVSLVGGKRHVAAPEPLQVGVSRVRADGDSRFGGEFYGATHDHRVARVHAACHVHACHQGNHLLVES